MCVLLNLLPAHAALHAASCSGNSNLLLCCCADSKAAAERVCECCWACMQRCNTHFDNPARQQQAIRIKQVLSRITRPLRTAAAAVGCRSSASTACVKGSAPVFNISRNQMQTRQENGRNGVSAHFYSKPLQGMSTHHSTQQTSAASCMKAA
jgi:hypothetical protein